MSETTESRLRTSLLIYFPMFIATLSLFTSIYNGYLNSRFVDFIQRNAGRTEYLRTCKEIIDAYFQIKVRIGAVNGAGDIRRRPNRSRQRGGEVWRARHLSGQPAGRNHARALHPTDGRSRKARERATRLVACRARPALRRARPGIRPDEFGLHQIRQRTAPEERALMARHQLRHHHHRLGTGRLRHRDPRGAAWLQDRHRRARFPRRHLLELGLHPDQGAAALGRDLPLHAARQGLRAQGRQRRASMPPP